MSLEQFLPLISVRNDVTLPTIPRTMVFGHYAPNEKKFYILSELPTAIRSISKNLRDGTARRYRLAMPWTYIWYVAEETRTNAWELTDHRIFFARERYETMDSPMIVAMLPNVYDDGRICWGSTGTSPNQSLADRIDTLTNEWYLSRFNADLDGQRPLPYGESNYARWVRETNEIGLRSYDNWPEWNSMPRYTVNRLLAGDSVEPRPVILTLADSIPPVTIAPRFGTFGAWEEWWNNLPAEQRGRAFTALSNIREDNPDFVPTVFPEDVAATAAAPTTPTDDGGTEIPYVR
jgi:hypothetical protein